MSVRNLLFAGLLCLPTLSLAVEGKFRPTKFQDETIYSQYVGDFQNHLGDLNGDGRPDMLFVRANYPVNNVEPTLYQVYWVPNDGTKLPLAERVSLSPNEIVYAREKALFSFETGQGARFVYEDVNADSLLDVLIYQSSGQATQLQVAYGTGTDSPFTQPVVVATIAAGLSGSIALADLDGDADLDMIGGIYLGDNSQYLLNEGSSSQFGPFSDGIQIGVARSRYSSHGRVAIGDLDGDGDSDIVESQRGQDLVYLNNGTSQPFSSSTQPQLIANDDETSFQIELVDLDQDGDLDLVSEKGIYGDTAVRYYLNAGTPSLFSSSVANYFGDSQKSGCNFGLSDFTQDGKLDILVRSCDSRQSRLYINTGGAQPFANTGPGIPGPNMSLPFVTADIDGDGFTDFVDYDQNLFLNNGFTGVPMPVLTVADAQVTEGDGNVDVLIALNAPQSNPVTVEFGTTNDFRSQTSATSGEDFYGVFESLTFAPGETEKSVRVTILDDDAREGDESFLGHFSYVKGANITQDVVKVTIKDNPAIIWRSFLFVT